MRKHRAAGGRDVFGVSSPCRAGRKRAVRSEPDSTSGPTESMYPETSRPGMSLAPAGGGCFPMRCSKCRRGSCQRPQPESKPPHPWGREGAFGQMNDFWSADRQKLNGFHGGLRFPAVHLIILARKRKARCLMMTMSRALPKRVLKKLDGMSIHELNATMCRR
jgi:hypothetical protein